ncbi:MAG: hypothetical protein MI754_08560, partial [Chromatiales bacterium]|nr:hypothetical protein [Chromatiales bacterium]
NSNVRFLNSRFDAWADGGHIYNSHIEKADAKIKNLFPATALKIDGQVLGPFSDTLRLLRETPLAEQFADLTQGLKPSGKSRLALDLAIPLRRGDWQVDGKLDFLKSGLKLEDWNLPITDITGSLQFDLDQIHAKAIKGEALNSAIKVDVETHDSDQGFTRILGHGNIDSKQLAELEPGIPRTPFRGSSDWQLQLDIPHKANTKQGKADLTLASDLAGVAIDLPTPLAKNAEVQRPLRLHTRFTGKPQQQLTLSYGDLLQTALLLETRKNKTALIGGEIVLGAKQAKLPSQPGLILTGHWPDFQLDEWLESIPDDITANSTDKSAPPTLTKIDLSFGRAQWGSENINNLQLDFERLDGGWQGGASSDRFIAALWIPEDLTQAPIRAQLDTLKLNLDLGQATQGENPDQKSHLTPQELPTFDIQIAELVINGKPFGKATAKTDRHEQGQRLSTLTVEGENLQFKANGDWTALPDNTHQTRLTVDLESGDFGSLLEDLGFTRNLDQAVANIDGELHWPGAPQALRLSNLNGELSLILKKGQFLNVDPGIGRIFGLINLNALQRRLTLDFKDLLNKGFAFDRIGGHFTLENGDAHTSDFELKGPAALIEITGRTGLATEDFDQQVTVSPTVSSTLPIAGAIAGGPAVGAALFVAQKLMGEDLDKVTQIQYTVTGPWSDPVITSHQTEPTENLAEDPRFESPSPENQ